MDTFNGSINVSTQSKTSIWILFIQSCIPQGKLTSPPRPLSRPPPHVLIVALAEFWNFGLARELCHKQVETRMIWWGDGWVIWWGLVTFSQALTHVSTHILPCTYRTSCHIIDHSFTWHTRSTHSSLLRYDLKIMSQEFTYIKPWIKDLEYESHNSYHERSNATDIDF